MTLFEQYHAVCAKYEEEYGKDIAVLFEVGSFYEVYGCTGKGCDVRRLCALLNIQATRKNKVADVSPSNPELGGFPSASLPKYLPILVDAGYTVVMVTQAVTNSGVMRNVTRVVSKGTYAESTSRSPSHELLCLYFQSTRKRLHGCGVALVDLRTGESHAFEVLSADVEDSQAVIDDVASKIACFNVCEALLIGDPFDEAEDVCWRLETIGISRNMMHNRIGHPIDFGKLSYQDCVLRKVYPDNGILTPAEFVGLERNCLALTAFVAILDFAHKHDEGLLLGMPVPTVHGDCQSYLKISPSTLKDLDIVGVDDDTLASTQCLSRTCDHCATTLGQRLFRKRFLRPITDTTELRSRYDAVEKMIAADTYREARKALGGICDIDRIWRRLGFSSTLKEIATLRESLRCADALTTDFREFVEEFTPLRMSDVGDVLTSFRMVDDDGSIVPGTFDDLDEAREALAVYGSVHANWLESFRAKLIGTKANGSWIRSGISTEPCAHVLCTPKRFELISTILGADFMRSIVVLEHGSSAVKFTHACVRHATTEICEARLRLDEVTLRRARELQSSISKGSGDALRRISQTIALIDVYASAAMDAVKHALVRPRIIDGSGRSFVSCRDLRHPLAERVDRRTLYVPNDISLNHAIDQQEEVTGVLLYGVNASGKSSLSKAVAVAAFMAQAGFFVACSSFEFRPFSSIHTRIASRDDIFRGKSTFMVELAELRNILHRANKNSLVVGDELCSGTESASAISIVGSACVSLIRKDCCFVFATHLHELPGLTVLKKEKKIGVYHLGVCYNDATDTLVYARKLQKGPGKALYGLEVARAMHMGVAFMADAHQIRREVLGISDSVVTHKTSQYSKDVYMDVCAVCKARPAVETHHVAPQRLADHRGFIGHFHKNAPHNLLPLCAQCHDDTHARVKAKRFVEFKFTAPH